METTTSHPSQKSALSADKKIYFGGPGNIFHIFSSQERLSFFPPVQKCQYSTLCYLQRSQG